VPSRGVAIVDGATIRNAGETRIARAEVLPSPLVVPRRRSVGETRRSSQTRGRLVVGTDHGRMNPFKPDHRRDGVRPINIYALRVLFSLMFVFVGFDAWSYILGHHGPWDHVQACAWCMFAAYSALSLLGVFYPLKMIPIVMFTIIYKALWLAVVAYPLWSEGRLAGSPAEGMARVFIWEPIAIIAVPWTYVVRTYIPRLRANRAVVGVDAQRERTGGRAAPGLELAADVAGEVVDGR
jgi:hypothetical protein